VNASRQALVNALDELPEAEVRVLLDFVEFLRQRGHSTHRPPPPIRTWSKTATSARQLNTPPRAIKSPRLTIPVRPSAKGKRNWYFASGLASWIASITTAYDYADSTSKGFDQRLFALFGFVLFCSLLEADGLPFSSRPVISLRRSRTQDGSAPRLANC
jgi:hypothetical protein